MPETPKDTPPETAQVPAKLIFTPTFAVPDHVPPVNSTEAVPVSAKLAVNPPVCQTNAPSITFASDIVVVPEIVTSWTRVMVWVPLIVAEAAVM